MDTKITAVSFWMFMSVISYCAGTTIHGCEYTALSIRCTGSNITQVPEHVHVNTTEISIKNAIIATLNTSTLSSIQNLVELSIEHSGVNDIIEHAFDDLEHLKMVSLKGNNLVTLQSGLFSSLKVLRRLVLAENSLTSVDGIFDGLTHLEVLSLSNNQIITISVDAFKDLRSLHHLELNNNKIRNLQPGTFANTINLMLLGLGSNPLSSLENIFPHDMLLQYLNMTACELTTFPNDLPSSLKHLKLTKNKIRQISKSDTVRYVNMNALILEENGLVYVEPGTFAHMTSLTDIFLFVNNLLQIPGPFPISMKTVYLDNNQIETIPVDMFQNGTNLDVLSLRINNISTVTFNAFQNVILIKELHLERNKITVLQDNMFLLAFGLKFLTLNRLLLTTIYPDCFLGLIKLKRLELSFVHVSKENVYGNIFRNLHALEELQLQESPTLARRFLTDLIVERKMIKTVTELNLQDNGLVALSSDVQKYLPNIQKLSLGGNKFHCNTNLLWLRNWNAIEPEKFYKFDQVRCHLPRHLQGQRVGDVKLWQFYAQTGSHNDSLDTISPDTITTTHGPGQTTEATHDMFDVTTEEYIYYGYDMEHDDEDYYQFDYLTYTTITITDGEYETTTSSIAYNATASSSNGDNIKIKNSNEIRTNDENDKDETQTDTLQSNSRNSSVRAVAIAIGTALGVIVLMLSSALLIYSLWRRKRSAAQENGRHQIEGHDYVFIATTIDKSEMKVHRKMSRAERGSSTSRASEDITNHTDMDMKVYMLDVDA